MSRPNAAPAFGSFVVSDLNEINFGRPSELADDEHEYDPKVFNLQLLIQKLEEELSVYRNGTTGNFIVHSLTHFVCTHLLLNSVTVVRSITRKR